MKGQSNCTNYFSILEAEAELALAKGELARASGCIEQLLGKYDELKLRHLKPGIAEHTGTPDLREIFLSRSDVQLILHA
jgi:hypothetical protein